MKESLLRTAIFLISISVVLAFAAYGVDVWLFSSNPALPLDDVLFMEAVFSVLVGILLLLGSGGIGRGSQRAAMLASTASAIGRDTIGPSEVYRRDAWKPKGYVRAGLVLVGTGIILLLIYFALFYR